jgi:hypothetical protein
MLVIDVHHVQENYPRDPPTLRAWLNLTWEIGVRLVIFLGPPHDKADTASTLQLWQGRVVSHFSALPTRPPKLMEHLLDAGHSLLKRARFVKAH